MQRLARRGPHAVHPGKRLTLPRRHALDDCAGQAVGDEEPQALRLSGSLHRLYSPPRPAAGGFFTAESQCSATIPFSIRTMSNQNPGYLFDGLSGSSSIRLNM